jgi:3D (Asp-Asp-Asp) domain-containing protein
MWISGYGWGTVRDKGSAVKGNRLDVWVSTEKQAHDFALKRLMVEVIPNAR